MSVLMEQEYFRMEPYLRKAVQNVAKQLYPEFMRPDDDKDQKEREFWVAVYNVPMVHRHVPPCVLVFLYRGLGIRTHARTRTIAHAS